MANLTDWANAVAGRYIDVDQWEGNQCWDLSQHWLTTCNGGTLWTQPSSFPGMAAGSWEVATGNTANTADLLRHVTAHPGTERGLPGDLIIWAYGSADYPISHTAVLMEDRGPILRTLSQNSSPARPDLPGYSPKSSGPTIYQNLTRAGILGFLRPRATVTGQGSGIIPIQEDDEMISDAQMLELKQFIQSDNEARHLATRDVVRNKELGYGDRLFIQQAVESRAVVTRDVVQTAVATLATYTPGIDTAKLEAALQAAVTKAVTDGLAAGVKVDATVTVAGSK